MRVIVSVSILMLLVFSSAFSCKATSYTNVTVSEAKVMIDSNPSLVILDVRTQSEYNSKHIRNAKLIPVAELEVRLDELNVTDEILVYCHSGARSAAASQILADNGFLYVYNMLGGITAWISEGYPVYVKYSSIQEAINNANPGDTLYISSGTYCENVAVNKSLTLIGENRNDTIIDGNLADAVISITVNNVTINEFTIQEGDPNVILEDSSHCSIANNTFARVGSYVDVAVQLWSSSLNTISDNTMMNKIRGISLIGSSNNIVSGNNITSSRDHAIKLKNSSNNNTVSGNTMTDNLEGVYIYSSSNNTISGNNMIANHQWGIHLEYSSNNSIYENDVTENNIYGIIIWDSSDNSIYHNNFVNNSKQMYSTGSANAWDNGCEGNYWSDYHGNDTSTPPDGIGDTLIPHQGVDYYPLTNRFWNPTDINHDLKVDIKDIATAAKAYGSEPGNPNWNYHADITGPEYLVPDGKVDIRDIALIAIHYGEVY